MPNKVMRNRNTDILKRIRVFGRHLPFKTVFQKTLFKSFLSFHGKISVVVESKVSKHILENFENPNSEDTKILRSSIFDQSLKDFVDAENLKEASASYKDRMLKISLFTFLLNYMYDRKSLLFSYDYSFTINDNYDNNNERKVYFWQGSMYNKDSDTIDHSKAAVDRSADLLTLMLLFGYIKKLHSGIDFDELWRFIMDPSTTVEIYKDAYSLIKRLSSMGTKSPSLVGRIFKNLDIEISQINSQRAEDEVKIRVGHLWRIL